MILADSDVLIDFLRGRQPAASDIADLLDKGVLATTAITAFELLAGLGDPERAETLVDALIVFDLDLASARAAATLSRELAANGTPIGTADTLIAGICLTARVPLFTRNERHFARVPGLALHGVDDRGRS